MLILDKRVGGDEHYVFAEQEDELMFIPEDILKCVVFVGYRLADKSYRLGGSAFWVVRPMAPDLSENFSYLVTAEHVIQKIQDKGLEHIYLRVNLKSGGLDWIETNIADWKRSPKSDVAVLQKGIAQELDHTGWPMEGFADEKAIESKRIGIGHEIFVAGMFSRRWGNKKNIPIVRMGNIAAMPMSREPVKTRIGLLAAYLVEGRSIGGISGSPVFVDINSYLPGYANHRPSFFLLGLMHGHFDVEDSSIDDATMDDGTQQPVSVNMGISIVVPSEEITAVVKEFADKDDEAVRAYREKMLPTMDAADVEVEPHPLTREDFEAALKKVSRKKS